MYYEVNQHVIKPVIYLVLLITIIIKIYRQQKHGNFLARFNTTLLPYTNESDNVTHWNSEALLDRNDTDIICTHGNCSGFSEFVANWHTASIHCRTCVVITIAWNWKHWSFPLVSKASPLINIRLLHLVVAGLTLCWEEYNGRNYCNNYPNLIRCGQLSAF